MTRTLITTLVALLVPTLAAAQPVQWPVSQGGNGHFYEPFLLSSSIDWGVANQTAQAAGGHLATITSAAENAFVFALVTSGQFGGYYNAWLGGIQAPGSPEPAGGWQWVTGEAFGYTNWTIGEPNNAGCTPNEDRIHLRPDGTWNDLAGQNFCGAVYGYIVEVPTSQSPEYQSNSVLATLAVNGIWGTAYAPANVTIPINTPAMLQLSSLNIGMAWELGLGLAPLVGTSIGGLVTSDNQFLNLDLTDPTFIMMWDFFQSPGFQNVTMPFSVPVATSLSAQMLVLDPYMASGLSLSQPVRLIVQ